VIREKLRDGRKPRIELEQGRARSSERGESVARRKTVSGEKGATFGIRGRVHRTRIDSGVNSARRRVASSL
jgi:hypothetical protein